MSSVEENILQKYVTFYQTTAHSLVTCISRRLDFGGSGPAEVDNDWSGRTSGFYGRYFQKEAQKDYRVSSGVLLKIEVSIR